MGWWGRGLGIIWDGVGDNDDDNVRSGDRT